jgi:N6-L-threonylcarbamoyladenine synthase
MLETATILGIESSCDETAAAVVRSARTILSSVVASQTDIHRKYGGVVPELASREHLRQIVPVVLEALERAALDMKEIDAIAVTRGPGLIGSLLVGVTYGKALALTTRKPLIGINHLEGHVRAVLLEAAVQDRPMPELPAVCLIVSGGHTVLYQVEAADPGPVEAVRFVYRRLGQTRDDAAGEAYDKVAKMLAFGYPGGPILDRLAAYGQDRAVGFSEPRVKGADYDFSFSGVKTAVLYYLQAHPELTEEIERRRQALRPGQRKVEELLPLTSQQTLDLIASFQRVVVETLVRRTVAAAQQVAARSVLVSGGVAANRALRQLFEQTCTEIRVPVYFPSLPLSTDNAAMIAAAAYPKFLAREFASDELGAEAVLPLA